MPIQGALRELGIHDVFQLLDLSRKTGRLRVTSALRNNEGTVLFRDDNGVWAQVAQSVVSEDLLAVQGLTSNGDVYAAGENGAFIHRAGVDWRAETFTTETLTSVYAPDEKHLIIDREPTPRISGRVHRCPKTGRIRRRLGPPPRH